MNHAGLSPAERRGFFFALWELVSSRLVGLVGGREGEWARESGSVRVGCVQVARRPASFHKVLSRYITHPQRYLITPKYCLTVFRGTTQDVELKPVFGGESMLVATNHFVHDVHVVHS